MKIGPRPEVSVIIPTYNRAWSLPATVDSVLGQTFQDFELIVVDDGSTDGTESLVREMPGAVYLPLRENAGVSAARNRGMERARGRFICFLDSDDRWLPGKLEAQWHWMVGHPDVAACYTDEIWIRGGVRVNPMKKHQKHSGWIFPHCLPLCIISPSSIMIRREVLAGIGDFDESLPACEDYDLWLRLTLRFPVKLIAEKLILKYGGHPDQLSKKFWGMDRFRVRTLENLLALPALEGDKRQRVLATLIRKCEILSTGFRHRGKEDEAESYARARDRRTEELNSLRGRALAGTLSGSGDER